jgi:outer membrane receptor protein involved in Fe transport
MKLAKAFCWLLPLIAASVSTAAQELRESESEAGVMEEIIVQATRSGRRLQDGALRVEVLSGEEIEEKLLMRPGNISMMLNETGGLRVQVTSPALGSANVRIHGMRGRYTQLLADGLPLYGGQASSLGLLQVPPSDLGQVEIIKGAASALYGGQALGGVINLVSKRPGTKPESEIILNATTRDGQDVSGYGESRMNENWSASYLANYSRQSTQDLDGDRWIDMPGYERVAVRPRLFYENDAGTRAFLTAGVMSEDRQGGTLEGGTVPSGDPFAQNQDTRRFDLGATLEQSLGDDTTAQLRLSSMRQDHDHRYGDLVEVDRHETLLLEASIARQSARTTWVGGAAYQADRYRADTFPVFDYDYRAPALFGQIDYDLGDNFALAGSARWDNHNEYGSQLSPRFSVLYRPGAWTIRGSWGRGFYAPTPFVEETEASGLSRLEPVRDLEAEQAETTSIDISYSVGGVEAGLTFFGSEIDDAVIPLPVTADSVRLINQSGPVETRGVEALLRWRQAPFAVTASYLYLDATEARPDAPGRRNVPLTPEHSAGLVAMWEKHGRGRLGLELYYTGEQSLADNPYRQTSKPYLHVGLLGEITLGPLSLFLNLENLLDVRQTRTDPLLQQRRTPAGSWTVDAWAPLEGFIANAGVRVRL